MSYIISRFIWAPWINSRIIRITGIEHISKKNGPVIYVSNHIGYYDPLLLIGVLLQNNGYKKVYSITKWPIFWVPIFKRWVAAIPLKRFKGGTYKKVKKALLEKKHVLIYPEGHVNNSDVITYTKTGAFRLALETRAEVIPIGLISLPDTKNFFGKLKDIFNSKMEIHVGTPIKLDNYYTDNITPEVIERVQILVLEKIAGLACKKFISN